MKDGSIMGFTELTGINHPKTDLEKAAKIAMGIDQRIKSYHIKKHEEKLE